MTHFLSATSLTFYLTVASLQNARADETNTTSHGQFKNRDFKFVCEAVQGGNKEVALSHLAVQKSSDSSVRGFAQRMVDDHQKANQELTQLASQKGAVLPDATDKKVQATLEHLQNLSGNDFDIAYMKDIVADHKEVVKMFRKEADHAEDADLKAWAAKTLPTLEEHLSMAQSTEAALSNGKQQTSTR